MANAASKKLARDNAQQLKVLHSLSAGIFVLVLTLNYFFGRSLKPLILMTLPAAGTEYALERSARPVFRDGQLISPGSDLQQKGLTEYMQDIIYMTWVCQVLSVLVGNRAWYLYWAIPIFAVYKGWNLLQSGRKLLGGGASAPAEPTSKTASSNSADGKLSKRQEKLRKRQEKNPQAKAMSEQANARARAQHERAQGPQTE